MGAGAEVGPEGGITTDTRFAPRQLLQLLNDEGVAYVLIGGSAVIIQGYERLTEDLDICYERSRGNVERLTRVLQQIHARPREWPADAPFVLDAQTILNGDTLTLMTDLGALDIMGTPDGTQGYGDLARSQDVYELGDTLKVAVASVPDLLRMKRASARNPRRAQKDLADIEALETIRREQKES